MSLKDNYQKIKQSLPVSVHLLVVSKNQTVASIETLYHLGQRDFGENRLQELVEKDQQTEHLPEINWHMIGPIQSNKIKKLISIKRLKAIHSIDRLEMITLLVKHQDRVQATDPIALFWEMNLSGESNKHGFLDPEELKKVLLSLPPLEKFYHQGLMCIGAVDDEDLKKTNVIFSKMFELKNKWQIELKQLWSKGLELSMGMSHDYVQAIKFGSDWVRVGSSIFKKGP